VKWTLLTVMSIKSTVRVAKNGDSDAILAPLQWKCG